MSNLYDVVKDVINAPNMEEANDRLFGANGISINSDEYFNNIVSNFIKKKEYIIRKENGNLVFDLNNYNDIWNIIFLGEYIKKTIDEEYNELLKEINYLENELNNINEQHKYVDTEDEEKKRKEHDWIVGEHTFLRKYYNSRLELKDDYDKIKESFNGIDWVILENSNDEVERLEEVNKLKQSINIIHKIRNSFQHGKSTIMKNLTISFNDKVGVSLPIDYLDGFNKGRIIASDEDKTIVEVTNTIASPLLETLGYDVKKVESFFYNVDPEWLSFLLEQVNYDYDELYKLDSSILLFKDTIKELFDCGYDFKFISELPGYALYNSKSTIRFLNYTDKNGRKIDINKLPKNVFYSDTCSKVLELFNNGIDINKFEKENQFGAIFHYKNVIELNNTVDGLDIYRLHDFFFMSVNDTKMFFSKMGDDIYKLPDTVEFMYDFDRIMYMYDNLGSLVFELPEKVFYHPELVVALYKNGIDIKKISNVYDYINPVHKNEDRFEQYRNVVCSMFDNIIILEENGIDTGKLNCEAILNKSVNIMELYKSVGEQIYNLPLEAFDYLDLTKSLISKGIDVNHFPYGAFKYSSVALSFINDNIDISKFPYYAFKEPEIAKIYLDHNIDLSTLPGEAFDESKVELTLLLSKYGVDLKYSRARIYYLLEDAEPIKKLEKYNVDISKIPMDNLVHPDELIDLIKRGVDVNNLSYYDIKNINKLLDGGIPPEQISFIRSLYNSSYIDFIILLYRNGIDLTKISDDNYNLIDPQNEFVRSPNVKDIRIDTIKKILEIFDNDYNAFNNLPIEFFTCDVALVEEMLKTYNTNVARSIFGINNPKLIGTLVYCDSVFKRYQKEKGDANLFDLDIVPKVMGYSYYDTYKYRNNIREMDVNKENYLNQFITDYNGNRRNPHGIKRNILDKLRNSICHFRFKPVKDSDGNIVEDIIYLYDKFDDGTNNFNIIMDIKDLVEIAREVEIKLNENESRIEANSVITR